jgi:hypothetical protein
MRRAGQPVSTCTDNAVVLENIQAIGTRMLMQLLPSHLWAQAILFGDISPSADWTQSTESLEETAENGG